MDDRQVELRRAIYRSFAEHGRAPSLEDIAATPEEIDALERSHAVALHEDGSIAFANPFAQGPTDFAVLAGETRYWAICAWDAFGILAATGRSGTVATTCPDCDEALALRVEDGGEPRGSGAVSHFLLPAARWYEDLRST